MEDNYAAPITTTVLVKVEKTKKRSLVSLIRATLIAMRCRRRHRSSGKKSSISASAEEIKSANTTNHGMLKRRVGCMRPRHLHLDDYRDPLRLLPPPPPNEHDSFHDVRLPPPSPAGSSVERRSPYASAEDLAALHDATEDSEGCEEEGGGSNSIDMRAEEFIVAFHEQMRLQRSNS